MGAEQEVERLRSIIDGIDLRAGVAIQQLRTLEHEMPSVADNWRVACAVDALTEIVEMAGERARPEFVTS